MTDTRAIAVHPTAKASWAIS